MAMPSREALGHCRTIFSVSRGSEKRLPHRPPTMSTRSVHDETTVTGGYFVHI